MWVPWSIPKASGDFQPFRWEWWCRSVSPLVCMIQDTWWYRYDTLSFAFKPWDSQMDWFYLDHQEGASLTVEVLPSSVRGDPNAWVVSSWCSGDGACEVLAKQSAGSGEDMEIDAEFPMVECFMALLFLHMGIVFWWFSVLDNCWSIPFLL